MADKKVQYAQGPLTLDLSAKDDLHPDALTPPETPPKLLTTKRDAEDVADEVARILKDQPKRLLLDADTSPDAIVEAARLARISQQNLNAGERMLALLRREAAQRRHTLQSRLIRVRNQIKAQLRDDPTLADDFKPLIDYFKPNT
jgi:hypothetical protein